MLADTAQRTVGGQRWWQRFETDVELGGFRLSALAIAGWTIVGGILASLVGAICPPVAVGPAPRPRRPVRDALARVAQGLQDAEGFRGAAGGQPRRAGRSDAHRALDDGRAQRHGRQRDRAVEVRVPPRPPGRAAGRSARRRAHGHGAPDARATTPSRSRSSCGCSARRAATRPRCSTASRRSSAVAWSSGGWSRCSPPRHGSRAGSSPRLPIFVLARARLHGRRLPAADARLARRQNRSRRWRRSWC